MQGGPGLSRRGALKGAACAGAAVLLDACGTRRRVPGGRPQAIRVGLYWSLPLNPGVLGALQASLQRAVPAMRLQSTGQVKPGGNQGDWWIVVSPDVVGTPVDLTEALKEINFDPAALVAGSYQSITSSGAVNTMPAAMQVMAIDYNPAAFAAASIANPSKGWTLEEFAQTCSQLETAIARGALAELHVARVLYPMFGGEVALQDGAQARSGPVWWLRTMSLQSPLLWETFIAGYGGAIVESGVVSWAQGGALAGLQSMIGLFARFGGGPAIAETQAALNAAWTGSAMRVVLLEQFTTPPTASRILGLAPFPRLPNRPVFGVAPAVWFLTYGPGGPSAGAAVSGPAAREIAPAQAIAAQFLQWLYGAQQQQLLVASGIAPVTVAGIAEARYWQAVGVGDRSRVPLFGYPWSPAAQLALRSRLLATASGARAAPTALPAILGALSEELTSALATGSSSGR